MSVCSAPVTHNDSGVERSLPTISVIIPTLNEQESLPAAIESVGSTSKTEVIVVDGGSEDDTRRVALELGARLTDAQKGRGTQMNAAAEIARGDVLLFLHADTKLPPGYDEQVMQILAVPGVAAGAFRMAFDRASLSLKFIQWGVNQRSRWLGLPYGDQAIFLKRDVFHQVGGFDAIPAMEDYVLIRRLKKAGRIQIAPSAVTTSARRYHRCGPWRTVLKHQRMILQWHIAGVIPP